ncbi:hypothetical protein [Bacillus sp. FJAT-22090]|nr:hypothetical protein [Bacillus sp. FJAT-22090]
MHFIRSMLVDMNFKDAMTFGLIMNRISKAFVKSENPDHVYA